MRLIFVLLMGPISCASDNMQGFSYLDCKFAIFPVLTDSCDIGTYHTFTRK